MSSTTPTIKKIIKIKYIKTVDNELIYLKKRKGQDYRIICDEAVFFLLVNRSDKYDIRTSICMFLLFSSTRVKKSRDSYFLSFLFGFADEESKNKSMR